MLSALAMRLAMAAAVALTKEWMVAPAPAEPVEVLDSKLVERIGRLLRDVGPHLGPEGSRRAEPCACMFVASRERLERV